MTAAIPTKKALQETHQALPKNAPAIKAIIGSFAPQDKGRRHDRHFAVSVIFNRPGSHNSRHPASCADQHRDKRFAGQTELTENAVHNKGNPRHITAAFQKCEKQKQYQHLRHKAQHSAYSRNNSINH